MTEKLITYCLLLGSSIYLFFANQLAFGSLRLPKSGFFPTIVGIIAISLTLLLILRQFTAKTEQKTNDVNWTKFIFLIIGLLFYIILFNIVGYFIATFILLFYWFKISDTPGLFIPFSVALASTTFFYFIFKYYLVVTLP